MPNTALSTFNFNIQQKQSSQRLVLLYIGCRCSQILTLLCIVFIIFEMTTTSSSRVNVGLTLLKIALPEVAFPTAHQVLLYNTSASSVEQFIKSFYRSLRFKLCWVPVHQDKRHLMLRQERFPSQFFLLVSLLGWQNQQRLSENTETTQL